MPERKRLNGDDIAHKKAMEASLNEPPQIRILRERLRATEPDWRPDITDIGVAFSKPAHWITDTDILDDTPGSIEKLMDSMGGEIEEPDFSKYHFKKEARNVTRPRVPKK